MGVDYEQLLKDNEAAKQGEIKQVNDAYGKTASDYQTEVDNQQQQLKDYEAEQTQLQQEQTDFAIDQINQQKEQAEKDYTKEQQAAYGDYKRQTDPYGANAEQMAALGLSQSGYSESSNVAMYTAYQNRVAAARASIEQAKLTFENAIREAKLTNDINLAKIAQETLEKSLALNMESIIYLGNLELEKAAKLSGIEQTYYDRAQDIRDAQAAEIARAQQEGMGIGTVITGPNTDVGVDARNGNINFGSKLYVDPDPPGATGNAGVTDEIKAKAAGFTNIADVDAYLTGLVNDGTITQEEGLALLEECMGQSKTLKDMVSSTAGWSVVDNGGINWLGGIDNNAIVKAPNGEQLSLKNLVNKLVAEGMGKSEAKKLVKELQDNLGSI